VRTHEDLEVWQKAVDFSVSIYKATQLFPEEEKFGLTAQLRRAAVSIPSNIAEGAARSGEREFLHFLSIAAGSTSEVTTQLLIARKIGVGNTSDLTTLEQTAVQLGKMLQGLMNSIKKRSRGLSQGNGNS